MAASFQENDSRNRRSAASSGSCGRARQAASRAASPVVIVQCNLLADGELRIDHGLQGVRAGAAKACCQHVAAFALAEEQGQFHVHFAQEGRGQGEPERGHQRSLALCRRQRQDQALLETRPGPGAHRPQQQAKRQDQAPRAVLRAQHRIQPGQRGLGQERLQFILG
jgi:hypothetical protein